MWSMIAARRADDDMHTVFQAGRLVAQGRPADQREHLDVVFEARQTANFLRHLVGQFAGRAEHHGLHGEMTRIQLEQQGQREGGGLAAAGLGLRDQVVPGQRKRQAGRLDRRHGQVVELRQIGEQRCRQGSSLNAAAPAGWLSLSLTMRSVLAPTRRSRLALALPGALDCFGRFRLRAPAGSCRRRRRPRDAPAWLP